MIDSRLQVMGPGHFIYRRALTPCGARCQGRPLCFLPIGNTGLFDTGRIDNRRLSCACELSRASLPKGGRFARVW